MKKWFKSFILGLILIPAISFSADLVNFSIDKNLYENLSSIQQQAIASKVTELNSFFNDDVFPKIPNEIKEKIKDLKVTISFSDKDGRDGLFIPDTENHNHKILVQLIQINSNGLKALLAHEFFHAVHFELNPNEATWVREGMAQLFEYITTDELNGLNLQAAIATPMTPLIGSYNIDDPNPAQYGHDMLYFYYLYKHCGGDQIFWSLSEGKDELKSTSLIDAVLKIQDSKNKECSNFSSSAISFEVAKNHNQVQLSTPEDRERFFLAPTNLSPKDLVINTPAELASAVSQIPLYSSLKLKLETWNNLKGQCRNCQKFYARHSYPYDVSEERPANSLKSYDVILVKTGEN